MCAMNFYFWFCLRNSALLSNVNRNNIVRIALFIFSVLDVLLVGSLCKVSISFISRIGIWNPTMTSTKSENMICEQKGAWQIPQTKQNSKFFSLYLLFFILISQMKYWSKILGSTTRHLTFSAVVADKAHVFRLVVCLLVAVGAILAAAMDFRQQTQTILVASNL